MSDRIVDFLTRENGLAENVTREADVAVVLRCVRDDLMLAWQAGEIRVIADVEDWLNARVRALHERMADGGFWPAGAPVTGDTTEEMSS